MILGWVTNSSYNVAKEISEQWQKSPRLSKTSTRLWSCWSCTGRPNYQSSSNSQKVSTTIPSDVRQGSPNFVGRQQDLKNLHEALQNEGKVSVCAVRGMGGVGKTELAVQYALSKEFQQRYVACYWFSLNQGI